MPALKRHGNQDKNAGGACPNAATPTDVAAPSYIAATPAPCCGAAEPAACCGAAAPAASDASCCDAPSTSFDWLLWGSGAIVGLAYAGHLLAPGGAGMPVAATFMHGIFELMNTMWWGLLLGIFFVGVLGKVPRDLVIGAFGRKDGVGGILKATGAGLAFDLCNHGILLVAMRLYERGATLGQVVAFLIASPWNSISLTVILIALIGLGWTLAFIVLSAVLAVVTGLIFEALVRAGTLPANPHRGDIAADFRLWPELARHWRGIRWSRQMLREIVEDGLAESRMILRWLLLGVVLAAVIRSTLSVEVFQNWFGPTLLGLGATLLATTIIEVCSEGSSPIAADLLNRAGAPGNAFTFLMAGAATDYTEVMGLRERTRSWRIALFLPLIAVPQVLVVGVLLNGFAG